MNESLYIIIPVLTAAGAGIAVWLIARAILRQKLLAVEAERDTASAHAETLAGELSALSSQLNDRNIAIQGLQKDVEYKNAELETIKKFSEERAASQEQEHEKRLAAMEEAYGKRLAEAEERHARETESLKEFYTKHSESLKQNYDKSLEETREANEKSLRQQIEAVKSQIASESEKVLKARQEEFSKHAKESFGTIAGDFNKNLQDMKTAFEANKKTQTETSSELKTHLEEAVKNLKDRTEDIGQKADHLASALRGQSKMQGCWGETQLGNILAAEGLTEGRDFDREETLRDELGIVIRNEDTGKRMRPDFILHYPDNTDIVVDCKTSLNALSDYMSAESGEDKKEAAERNLKSINDHVEELSKKDYSSYLKPGHKCLDYTVMFVPNVNALILARQLDPLVSAKAYRKGVLITSEETFIPFLNLVRTAWVNFEQARNQEKIVVAAQRMVDRVSEFCEAYAAMGKKLDEARKFYEKGGAKISDSGQSILKAAHDVVALGIRAKKKLPPMDGTPLLEDGEIENQIESQ